jgi:hypothetical protein
VLGSAVALRLSTPFAVLLLDDVPTCVSKCLSLYLALCRGTCNGANFCTSVSSVFGWQFLYMPSIGVWAFTGMQRIDLVCLIASPLGTGLLMSSAGVPAGVVSIALWNIAAWYPECALLRVAQARAPILQYVSQLKSSCERKAVGLEAVGVRTDYSKEGRPLKGIVAPSFAPCGGEVRGQV